jgi:hypothetical protein
MAQTFGITLEGVSLFIIRPQSSHLNINVIHILLYVLLVHLAMYRTLHGLDLNALDSDALTGWPLA